MFGIKNKWDNCPWAERHLKEVKQKLTIGKGVICNGDVVVPPAMQRSKIIKCVHNDVHCGITSTQMRLRLEAWWPGYSIDVEEYIKRCKTYTERRKFRQTKPHTWPQESQTWDRVCIDYTHANNGIITNTGRCIFRLARSNTGFQQKRFVCETSVKGHIFTKWNPENVI